MIIREFTLSGFGIFSGQTVPGLPDGLSIFLGDNEAGKSTCLQFFRTMLFGYPRGQKFAPLRGGESGGSLLLETRAQGPLRLERRPGKHGLTLRTPAGKALDAALLDALLGDITYKMYLNVYGFSLAELQAPVFLDPKEVGRTLYDASFGTGTRPVGDVLAQLQKRMDDLYLPKGKRLLNGKFKEWQEVDRRHKEWRDTLGSYSHLATRRDELEARLESLRADRAKARTRYAALERRVALWEEMRQLHALRSELAALTPVVEQFPQNGEQRLDLLRERLREERAALHAAHEKSKALQSRYETLDIPRHAGVLEHAATIASLVEEKGTYRANSEQRTHKKNALLALREQWRSSAETLGPGWDAAAIRRMDLSIFTRERIEQFRASMATAEAEAQTAHTEADRRKQEWEASCNERDAAGEQLARLNTPNAWADPVLLELLESERVHIRALLTEMPHREETLATAGRKLDAAIANIAPGWTRRQVVEMDSSLTAREAVAAVGDRLAQAERAEHDASLAWAAAREAEQVQRERLSVLSDACPGSGALHAGVPGMQAAQNRTSPDAVNALREALQNLRIAVGDWRAAESAWQHLRKRESLPGTVWGTGCLGGACAAAGTALVGHGNGWWQIAGLSSAVSPLFVWGLAAAGMVFFAVAAYAATSARRARKEAFSEREHRRNAVVICAGQLGLAPSHTAEVAGGRSNPEDGAANVPGEKVAMPHGVVFGAEGDSANARTLPSGAQSLSPDALLLEAERVVDRLQKAAWEQEAARQAFAEGSQEYARLAQQASRAELRVKSAQEALENARRAWEEHARQLALPVTTPPQVAVSVFDRVDALRAELHRMEADAGVLQSMRQRVETYAEKARRLLAGNPEGSEDAVSLLSVIAVTEQLDSLIAAARRGREAETERARLAESLREREAQCVRREEALSAAQKARILAETTRECLHREWRQWLAGRGLVESLSPSTALTALETISDCQSQLGAIAREEQAVAALQTSMEAFTRRVETLIHVARSAGHAVPSSETPDDAYYMACVDALAQALDDARSAKEEGSRLERDKAENGIRVQEFTARLRGREQEYRSLLASGGVVVPETKADHAGLNQSGSDGTELPVPGAEDGATAGWGLDADPSLFSAAEEAFLLREQAYTRRHELLRKLAPLEASLADVAREQDGQDITAQAKLAVFSPPAPLSDETGSNSSASPILFVPPEIPSDVVPSDIPLGLFALPDSPASVHSSITPSREEMEEELADMAERLKENEEQVDAVRQEISDIKVQLTQLGSAETASVLRAQEAGLREDIHGISREWARLSLAKYLLEEAKSRFERERQPDIIRRAGAFFRTMTNGAYTGIYAGLDGKSLCALLPDGGVRGPEELSQGTREQLYLSLRLGSILSRAEQQEPLPVIMDDILVNFDPGRTTHAAAALGDLAEQSQILFFTCHPQTAERLRSAVPTAALFHVADGDIQPQA